MSILIIEGTDGVGKTTYATKVAAAVQATYLHAEKPADGNDWFDEYITPIVPGEDYVLDRWHVGELVWPTIFGRESLFNRYTFEICCRMLENLGAELQIVVRDPEAIAQELRLRGETERQIERSLAGQELFIDLYSAGLFRSIPTTIVESDLIHGPINGEIVSPC